MDKRIQNIEHDTDHRGRSEECCTWQDVPCRPMPVRRVPATPWHHL